MPDLDLIKQAKQGIKPRRDSDIRSVRVGRAHLCCYWSADALRRFRTLAAAGPADRCDTIAGPIHNGCNADTHLLASALVGKVALR